MDDLLRLFRRLESSDTWEERDRCEERCLVALEKQMKLATVRLLASGGGVASASEKEAEREVLFQVYYFQCGIKEHIFFRINLLQTADKNIYREENLFLNCQSMQGFDMLHHILW